MAEPEELAEPLAVIIVDVSDPTKPKEAGRWWYPGQKDGEDDKGLFASFHGPVNVSPDGKTATIGYTPSVLNLDISDVAHPKMIGEVQMRPPFAEVGTQSVHSVLPLWDRYKKLNTREPQYFEPRIWPWAEMSQLVDRAARVGCRI